MILKTHSDNAVAFTFKHEFETMESRANCFHCYPWLHGRNV